MSATVALAIFALATLVILAAGARLAGVADRLADRTGLGEALVGAVLLGAATSLSGLTTSIVAASRGLPELAVSNAVGGIAAQTVFLVAADFFHKRVNLEHAAASIENLVYGIMLAGMLAVPLIAMGGPDWTLFGIHPASLFLVGFYLLGLRLARRTRHFPQWQPENTQETRMDEPDGDNADMSLSSLIVQFAVLAGITGIAGWGIAMSGETLMVSFSLSESVTGALLTAVATSTPELVTTIAAVRRGALTLAVGGIMGGNLFDVLFLAGADAAYRDGSIYHAISGQQSFLLALTILMTAVLIAGLIVREKRGFARIGFESSLVLLLYVGGMALLAAG
ncbi:sodium:calcium antiporter [Aquisalinus flavus]|uniref:Cation transporter n=1 Tax=Aquisalinus flavus TaxID=1526572 RepID=A0A8J2V3V5_9PROT|nr:sodium:calcium antiporter [Aquisalinus flavus]MBD0426957.1 sodium:calcium antiporter [Aquisalinus flavus]UNE46796.1 sodium:calcium antiporter [Aquisalinus flavus]GGC97239.1 cation transporter [Aquisalinus flavus]